MNPASEKMLEQSLSSLVLNEIGEQRWNRILTQLAEAQCSTGGVLRAWPRRTQTDRMGNDDRYPVRLFAPDRDKEGREFESLVGGELVYVRHHSDHKDVCKYAMYSKDHAEWWRHLTNQQKGLVISVLSYILRAPGDRSTIIEFLGKKW